MQQTTRLKKLDTSKSLGFVKPSKEIHDYPTLELWQTSEAYFDVMTFLSQLNLAMIPTSTYQLILSSSSSSFSPPILGLIALLQKYSLLIQDVPPDTGPRRFGNVAFRTWITKAEACSTKELTTFLPALKTVVSSNPDCSVVNEVLVYLHGAFGSAQRLDYGTGHELAFLAFLACLCKLNILPLDNDQDARDIVLGVIAPYFTLIRTIIKTYTLEPAGSHGVWGLDDHVFLPYIFGSAQLAPPLLEPSAKPTAEGSADWAPLPSIVTNRQEVSRLAPDNLYFGAIQFIYEVKRGPFGEHSPMLYDISGVPAGWAKINVGMQKMFKAEVMNKFPVVQHFMFGSILKWNTHAASVSDRPVHPSMPATVLTSTGIPMTKAPWAK